ncbi:MAG TPA: TonB-dependent receptor [Bacteroidales bacterium]
MLFKKPMLAITGCLIISFLLTSQIQAAILKGHILDGKTREPLVGALIVDKQNNLINDLTGLDGSFIIKNANPGTHIFVIQYLGYITQEKEVAISTNNDVLAYDFLLEPEMIKLDQVEIDGSFDKESSVYARSLEKGADNVLNAMSAKTIQLLPDNTIASVLQRMSGVSVERTSSGEPSYAIIRGMDRRYNYTLVNGIKIPSPDNNYRYVPMDMFPADLLARLEVIKTLTPSMEGDAIGGAMNLVMKDAPDRLTISANAGTGFSELLTERKYTYFDKKVVSDKSPADLHGSDYQATPYDFTYKNFDYKTRKLPMDQFLGLSIGNRFLKEKQLGIMLAMSYQNLFKGSDRVWLRPENQPQPGNVPSFDDIYIRKYNTQSTRYGFHSKIDYEFSPNNKISLYNLYLEMDEAENRESIDTSLSIGRDGVGTGNTYLMYRSKIRNQSIYNSTLQGEHTFLEDFKVNWSGVYSLAKSNSPDWSEYQTVQQVGFDINHNHTSTPQVLNIPFYRIWTRNSDKDLAGYLNLSYHKKLFEQDVTFAAGGLYRDKSRDNKYNEWDLVPKTSSSGQPVPYDGNLTPDKFADFNGVTAAEGSPINPLTYTATEKITAYYIQATILLHEKFSVLGGVRAEQTDQGWKTAQDPKIAYGATGTVRYTDMLPSLHLKYRINGNQNLRLSYFSAINRPGFFEYVPYTISGDNFSISGNPKLLHATSDNFDVRYEFFPNSFDQLLAGVFYKKITNPIETGVKFTGTSSATLVPDNFGTAQNYGLELAFAKYWGHIGLSGNYTYTNSKITTSKFFYNASYITVDTVQTRPLQGQSPHIGNVSVLFKNPKTGLNAQLALVYTGKNIVYVSPFLDLDYWQRSTAQLSFSIEKHVFKYFTIYLKANNLLNTPVIVEILKPNIYRTGKFALPYQTRSDRVTVQKDYYGQSFTFGIRFRNLNNN